jgi:predicted nucleic acid-binding protein
MFIEVAAASQADFLVTGNLKHFPEQAQAGGRIVSPRTFLEVMLTGS